METQSFWQKISTRNKTYPALSGNIEVDILIIGGGITGVTAALQLIEHDKSIAIIDAHQIGGATTSMSTGNLYIPVQPYYHAIEKKFNLETVKAVVASRQYAINHIENNVNTHKISCNFSRRPWYGYTGGEKEKVLSDEYDILQKLKTDVEYIDCLPFDLNSKKAFKLNNQARFNPLQYVLSLAEILDEKGCFIFENTFAKSIEEKKTICHVETNNGKITAKKVFLATHVPAGINSVQTFIAPYRSYVVAGALPHNEKTDAHFWDFDGTKHAASTHARLNNHIEEIMVAGDHHKTGQGHCMKQHFQNIEDYLVKHFSVTHITYQWSAQHYHSADDIPYIGLASKSSQHVYMATGYFADGLVYGTIAGLIVADSILHKKSTFAETFSSNRHKLLASLPSFLKENLNVLAQYAKDLPLPSATKDAFVTIKAGEGKVMVINREKCAISRDHNQNINIVSAVCPHMKCIVNWNDAEQTWDCPCHGSRFTATGKYIEGPAMADLEDKKDLGMGETV